MAHRIWTGNAADLCIAIKALISDLVCCFCSKCLFEFASSLCLAEKSKRGVGDDVGEVVGLVVAAVLHPVAVRGYYKMRLLDHSKHHFKSTTEDIVL